MITRYKKAGGFIQLLCLIETFGKQKQEKFLNMIREESPVWAEALEQRLITIDRIFTWPPSTLAEIMNRVPIKNLAVALHGLSNERREQFFSLISHAERRKLESQMEEEKPSEGEVTASLLKLIEATREMLKNSILRFDQTDEAMIIPENIEEKLLELTQPEIFNKEVLQEPSFYPEKTTSRSETLNSIPTDGLQQRVLQLQKENQALKFENKQLKEKLANIKRLAA